MGMLESIASPRDLRDLTPDQLTALASEIRDFLVSTCSRTGGHLGPNLGVVELTLAVHRVFDSPRDRVVFDTGHQAYVHKLLTGRRAGFEKLRQEGGLSGYPSQEESEHDIVENSHASTALSYADGLAKAYAIRGEDRHVVAVIGDGALTGGMAWEALNNIASTTTAAPTPRPWAAWRPRSPRCAPTPATSRSSTWSRSGSTPSRVSARRRTTCCTR
jgi:1-deoxy-D-xylulose-5-phosphate synthase